MSETEKLLENAEKLLRAKGYSADDGTDDSEEPSKLSSDDLVALYRKRKLERDSEMEQLTIDLLRQIIKILKKRG